MSSGLHRRGEVYRSGEVYRNGIASRLCPCYNSGRLPIGRVVGDAGDFAAGYFLLYGGLFNKIGVWCNGSTADFGSVYLGSNPGTPARVKVEDYFELTSLAH